ncbi:hypothetical protein CGRAC_1864 [Campylobacter gracilis]|uniref:Uncharacterized protein n=1 Tax=Campylobacter gracilis RM3268 TaxID=553220 RepID=C8PHN3_9BACT|nr:hypothetical protein CGRAC_1864 [Campylobacter gracilis]EEV17647.1 hypothetical protein CAMGR0001_0480 [Campylobacter gracilis RM3268]SUW78392.1 Uncharacterised protein [Campylobacter gracilis]
MSEKIKLARTGLEPETCLQLILNPKFIKIIKRLYLEFFALYILIALSAFVLPENIGDNAACAGFVSLMKQFFKCRHGRDWLMRRICGALLSCDVGG